MNTSLSFVQSVDIINVVLLNLHDMLLVFQFNLVSMA